tara:strand:+ start:576 stop:1814 length:1239 start_codon:yes stop_codon:yes gene_type:complete
MAVALPTLRIGVRFVGGADNDGWSLGASPLPTQLGEPDDISVYEDVYSDLRSFQMSRGRSRELEQYQAGTGLVVLDNLSRNYDPLNLSGDHVDGGVTQIQPGRRIRVQATHPTTSVVYDLFFGTIREWDLDYPDGYDATASAHFSDSMTDLARTSVTVTTTAGLSGVAAAEILDAANFSRIEVDGGIAQLQATAFSGTHALAALQRTATSDQGAVYVDHSGFVQYDDRHALLTETRSNTSQFTFGAAGLPILSVGMDYSSDLIKNAVAATRSGGSKQSASDAASIILYGENAYALTNMMLATDADALTTAEYILSGYAYPDVRIRSVTLAPQESAALMTAALSLELRDRVTVTFQPPGGGAAISQELFVERIRHNIAPNSQMSTQLTFSSTETSFGWTLGVSELGTSTILAF